VGIAEELNRMGCPVQIKVAGGTSTVDSVERSEALSQELFSRLQELHHLRSLRLRAMPEQADRPYLRNLASLWTLRNLNLFGRDVDDGAMPYICSLTNLESLILWDVRVGADGLAHLPQLTALKRLELSSFTKINQHGVEAVAKLRNLEYLRVYGRFEDAALRPLSALPKLETVWISGSQINALLADLESVPSIRRIEIAGSDVDATTVERLTRMTNLQSLKLECCTITPEAAKGLQALRLRELDCIGIPTETLGQLANGMPERHGDMHVSY
jgi:Leucine-rich repeat (LRR) protein